MSSPKTLSGLVPKPTGLQGSELVPKSRNSLVSGLWDQPGPTDSEHIRILLSEAASKALLEAGECFMIAGRGSYPDADGTRVVLHLVPIPKSQADAACRVALGTHRAVKIQTKPSTP